MQSMNGEQCPFNFNFDPMTFKVGDLVSYRIPDKFPGFPFMGTILAVHDDYIELTSDPNDLTGRMKATRESRPIVANTEVP